MKKSEYIKRINNGIDMMFDSVGDDTLIGRMFAHNTNINDSFTRNDFINFLNSPYLNSHLNIFSGFYQENGDKIDLDKFKEDCAKELLNYFQNNNIKKTHKFDEIFNYKSLTNPQYFIELAEIISNTISNHGKPPLFHKRADKILRYDWEKE